VPTIDTLRRDQLAEASSVLARAFDDDPVFRFLYPTPRRRRWTCRGFLRSIVRDALPFDEVWAAFDDDVVVGTAGWLPEGTYPPSSWRAARLLLSAWDSLLTPQTFRDGLRYLSETEKLHPKEPHWYLAVIGVEPARQGEGLGGKLLAAVLERLDTNGVPGYLETSTEANVAWYRHHGFEVQNEVNPARTGPPVWTMWREPRA
jgi:ribosomal protein S18 acetylase RimI-like enzyme